MSATHTDGQSALISMLLAEHHERQQVDAARQICLQKKHAGQQGKSHMQSIAQKLSLLERTLLKRTHQNYPCHDSPIARKYEQLNALNERLRKALSRMGSNKGNSQMQWMEEGVIGLYNASVTVLTSQDRLNMQLDHLHSQNQAVVQEITQTKAEIEQKTDEVAKMQSVRSIALKRLQRLSACTSW